MKIIKEGYLPENRRYRVTCTNCNSILEYFHYEIKKVYYDQREGESHELGACPLCKKNLRNYTPIIAPPKVL